MGPIKALARAGAVLSFTFLFSPGAWLVATTHEEPLAVVLGMVLMGVACFAGPMLWLAGERVSGDAGE